ncbi:hypothetical protein [Umezawaea sp. Da 62-37]|uniref:hypothetical protein n=1 Tax=Umezawaea sp. Da 62-37 TaxID=3075927 RepID=UPI0028F7141B|nr:hypothetical protein [Umezawaea sp. Da 62-37]WNV83470.1 hypothetical protein RM788_35570 [Umezawaea sp. Da 62-37]
MPRRTRTDAQRTEEDTERQLREEHYRQLEVSLHRKRRDAQVSDAPDDADIYSDGQATFD